MCKPCKTCGTTDATKFYTYPNGRRRSECRNCINERNKANNRKRKLEEYIPKPKEKNKFTEGAKQVLGYYEIY